ncbi:hypothetical protein D3C87_1313150 [compost metagenome]
MVAVPGEHVHRVHRAQVELLTLEFPGHVGAADQPQLLLVEEGDHQVHLAAFERLQEAGRFQDDGRSRGIVVGPGVADRVEVRADQHPFIGGSGGPEAADQVLAGGAVAMPLDLESQVLQGRFEVVASLGATLGGAALGDARTVRQGFVAGEVGHGVAQARRVHLAAGGAR